MRKIPIKQAVIVAALAVVGAVLVAVSIVVGARAIATVATSADPKPMICSTTWSGDRKTGRCERPTRNMGGDVTGSAMTWTEGRRVSLDRDHLWFDVTFTKRYDVGGKFVAASSSRTVSRHGGGQRTECSMTRRERPGDWLKVLDAVHGPVPACSTPTTPIHPVKGATS